MTVPTMLTTTATSSTAGALSPDELTDERIRLWPYVPGVYGRDALYRVWKAMEDDGATKQAFWDEAILETGGDLASFIKAFDGVANKLLLMIERRDSNQLCGCFWVSQIQWGHQAFVGMWMQTSSRGKLSVRSARMALRYTFQSTGARQVWALTPWNPANALCRLMGFERVASLLNFCQWGDYFKTVRLFRLTRERFNGIDLYEG